MSWRDSFKIFILNTKLVVREPDPDLKLRVEIGSRAETCDFGVRREIRVPNGIRGRKFRSEDPKEKKKKFTARPKPGKRNI